jgi:adenylate cyclase
MDSHVVDLVLQQRGELSGDKRELTVLFCDIKGFTRFSETHSPEEVVKALNRFLEKMTTLISKHQGTVDKYMGDSVMAFWGAPKILENHAMLAVQAGFEMLKNQDMQGFSVSVGINTGPMIVGNIGSTKHISYTVIGDAVNSAARLQSIDLPNRSDSQLIISEATYRLVQKNIQARTPWALPFKVSVPSSRAWMFFCTKR